MSDLGVSDLLKGLSEAVTVTQTSNTILDYSGKSISLNTPNDADELINSILKFSEGNLKTLVLKGNTLGVEAAKALGKALEGRPELTRALWSDLFTGRMKTEIPEALSALGKGMMTSQAQLTVLDLSDNAFGPIGVSGLADLLKSPVCKFLKELYLNNNGIGITGTKLFVESLKPIPEHIEIWEMGRNRLENVGATALSGIIRNLPKLRVLRIPQNGIYFPGLTALCSALQNCPKLNTLDLNDNTVGQKGALELSKILHMFSDMEKLNLGDCLLKTKGAISVLSVIDKVPKLKELNLSFNELGSKVVPYIQTVMSCNTELVMKLGGNTLGSAGRSTLVDAYGQRAEVRALDDEDDDDDEEQEDESDEENQEDDETHDSGASSGEEATSENDNVKSKPHNEADLTNGKMVDNETSALDLSFTLAQICDETTPVGRFVANPSSSNLEAMGTDPVTVIAQYLNTLADDIAYVECGTQCIMGILGLSLVEDSRKITRLLVQWSNKEGGRRWLLANAMLSSLNLIKSERRVTTKYNIENSVSTLAKLCTEGWFPSDLLDTLKFFIKLHVEDSRKSKAVDFTKYPSLYQ